MDQDFVQLVKAMRIMQQAYFRDRDSETLTQAKKLERLVDRRINEFTNDQSRQKPLFPDSFDTR